MFLLDWDNILYVASEEPAFFADANNFKEPHG